MQTIIQRLKGIGGKDFIGIIISVIAVTAFLIGLNFFISSPSLKVSLHKSSKLLDPNLLYKFYRENNFNIPLAVKNTIIDEEPTKIKGVGINSPLILKLKFFNPVENPKFFESQAEILENDLINEKIENNYVFHPPTRSGVPIDSLFSEVLPRIKSSITASDYYKLLVGVKSSIKHLNAIKIENNGDIDLKNIKIYIPFPLSEVYGNREKTFIEIWPTPINAFHTLDRDKSKIIIQLPILHENKAVSGLYISTKETPIYENEIAHSYDKVITVDVKETITWSAILLFFSLFIHCAWPRKQ